MKLLYITILVFFSSVINAEQIDSITAQTVAINFMQNAYPNKSDYNIKSVIENKIKDINTTYIIEFNSGGYVIVSADNATIPVFMFSENGQYNKNDIPPAAQQWFQYYNNSVYRTIVENVSNKNTFYKWDMIINNNKASDKIDTIVAPLIQTEWGQSKTNDDECPGYNYYMPSSKNKDCSDNKNADCSDDCDKCTTGCGAVAMAQIMRYWAHPYKIDNHYFDWCNMPIELLKFFSGTSNLRPQYETERNEIAKLMHICGQKTDMSYCVFGTCQSFNWPSAMRDAFENDFKYDKKINIRRRQYYTDKKWKKLIKKDLDKGQPILYSGVQNTNKGTTSHAFVCDGYGTQYDDDYFHFNFGWRGSSYDTFLHIDSIADFDGLYFLQRAIFEIKPNDDYVYDKCDEDLTVYYYYKFNPEFSHLFYEPAYGEIFSSPSFLYIEGLLDKVSYTANHSIHLKNFHVVIGGQFRAQIIQCPSECAHASKDAGKETTEEDNKQTSTNNDEFCLEENNILLYPNPAKQTVTIEIKIPGDEKCNCTITDISGKQYFSKQFNVSNKYFKKEISLSTFPAGIYFVSFRSNNIFETKKLIVNK